MAPLHQMAAERLDETSVKTIQTKVNNKLDPAVPVRTHIRRRVQSLAALARSTNPADSPREHSLADSLTTSPTTTTCR